MIQRTKLFGALFILFPLVSSAAPIPRFSDLLESQVSSVENAMSSQGNESQLPEFALHQFYLKLSPEVGFNIPEIADIQVSPEIGLIWEKQDGKPPAP